MDTESSFSPNSIGAPNLTPYRPESLRALAASLAEAAGVRATDAALLAELLVEADIQGTSTHGISRLAIYLRRIQKGLIDPRADLGAVEWRGGAAAIDAANGLGQVQACRMLDLLIERARTTGVAAATIRNSQHFGSLSSYCGRAAKQDMILLAMSNGEPAMAPAGGCEPFFGTNPIAASFPTGKGFPIKIDLATSLVARGNIIAAQKKGESIPAGWALDPDGNPTTDANAALLGTVMTMAGHKGYALALLVEMLTGVLSGAAVGSAVGSMYKNMERKQDVGHFFCVLNIAAFMDVAEFKRRIDSAIDAIKASRRRSGVEEILVPGERSHRTTQENLRTGVRVDAATIRELETLCRELGVPFTLLAA